MAETDVPPAPDHPSPTLCGRPVAVDRALVMAIVNRTPDSFYDRGATFTDSAAMSAVDRAVDEGADLVDIGGVKAGPGDVVDAAEETRRVVPFVAAIRERYPELLISVDTWRSDVARLAVAEGADLINDTWAGADPALVEVAAETGAGIVCSPHRGSGSAHPAVPCPLRRRRRRRPRGSRVGRRERGPAGCARRLDPHRSDPRFREKHLSRARVVAASGRSCKYRDGQCSWR